MYRGLEIQFLAGGRYDNLIKVFGRDEKAIGFSINIDCLIELVKGKSDEVKNEVIIKFNKENEGLAMRKALEIIKSGGSVKMFPSEDIKEIIIKNKEEKNGD